MERADMEIVDDRILESMRKDLLKEIEEALSQASEWEVRSQMEGLRQEVLAAEHSGFGLSVHAFTYRLNQLVGE